MEKIDPNLLAPTQENEEYSGAQRMDSMAAATAMHGRRQMALRIRHVLKW